MKPATAITDNPSKNFKFFKQYHDCNYRCNETTCKEQKHNDIIRSVICQKVLLRRILQSFNSYRYRKVLVDKGHLSTTIDRWRLKYHEIFSVDWMLDHQHFGLLIDKMKRENLNLFYPKKFSKIMIDRLDVISIDIFQYLFRIYHDEIRKDKELVIKILEHAFLGGRQDIIEYVQNNSLFSMFKQSSISLTGFTLAILHNHLDLVKFCAKNFDYIPHDGVNLSSLKSHTFEMANLLYSLGNNNLLLKYIGKDYIVPLLQFGNIKFYETIYELLDPRVTLHFDKLKFHKTLDSILVDFDFEITKGHLQLVDFLFQNELGITSPTFQKISFNDLSESVENRMNLYQAKLVFDDFMENTKDRKKIKNDNTSIKYVYFKNLVLHNNQLLNKPLTEYLLKHNVESIFNFGNAQQIRLVNQIQPDIKLKAPISLNINHTLEVINAIKETKDLRNIIFLIKDAFNFDPTAVSYLIKIDNLPRTSSIGKKELLSDLYLRNLFDIAHAFAPEYHLKLEHYRLFVPCPIPSLSKLKYINSINKGFVCMAFQTIDDYTTMEEIQYYVNNCEKGETYSNFVRNSILDSIAHGRLDLLSYLEPFSNTLTQDRDCLQIAILFGQYEIAEYLLKKMDPSTFIPYSLLKIVHSDLKFLKLFVSHMYDKINTQMYITYNNAVIEGNLEAVKYILEIFPSEIPKHSISYCADKDRADVLEYLLDYYKLTEPSAIDLQLIVRASLERRCYGCIKVLIDRNLILGYFLEDHIDIFSNNRIPEETLEKARKLLK